MTGKNNQQLGVGGGIFCIVIKNIYFQLISLITNYFFNFLTHILNLDFQSLFYFRLKTFKMTTLILILKN